jgi:hypothetical protein
MLRENLKDFEKEGHTTKLILVSLGQVRLGVIDEAVNWFFSSENHVKIGYILSYTKLGDAKKKDRKLKLIQQG